MYQNQYRMTYICRPNKEKKGKGKKMLLFLPFPIFFNRNIISYRFEYFFTVLCSLSSCSASAVSYRIVSKQYRMTYIYRPNKEKKENKKRKMFFFSLIFLKHHIVYICTVFVFFFSNYAACHLALYLRQVIGQYKNQY